MNDYVPEVFSLPYSLTYLKVIGFGGIILTDLRFVKVNAD